MLEEYSKASWPAAITSVEKHSNARLDIVDRQTIGQMDRKLQAGAIKNSPQNQLVH